ncbi:MAG: exopolysaccharide biosynthesis protein [Rickettsiales bacterium]|nr:exopolysaccharide biosynthesis protein [Rickettsiales bacterium]
MTRAPHSRLVSEDIEYLIDSLEQHDGMPVSECLTELGRSSFAFVIILLSLICALPGIPGAPGIAALFGIPISIFGLQLAFGYDKLWLPRRIKRATLRPGKFLRGMKKLLPYLKKIEKHLKPRWPAMTNKAAHSALGLMFFITGILVALPIPFTNSPLGLSMAIGALGLLERDGAAISVGIGAMLLSVTIIGFMATGVLHAL